MSIAVDPQRSFVVVPSADKDLPEERRRRFVFHHLTGREWCELSEFTEKRAAKGLEEKPPSEQLRALGSLLSKFLSGWSGVMDRAGAVVPWTEGANLLDVLGPDEMWEVYSALTFGARASVAEKNASGSPSPSATAGSAPASAIPANAPDRPAAS